jgi:hypothetical protein
MKNLLILVVLTIASGFAGAQDKIYRCGKEYTNTEPGPGAKDCKLLEGGKGVAVEKKRRADPEQMSPAQRPPIKSVADAKRLYPDLAGFDDNMVVDALHQTYYADLPREKVAAALGVKPSVARAVGEGISANGSGSVKAPKQELNWGAVDAYLASGPATPEATKPGSLNEAISDTGLGAAAAIETPASPGRDVVGSIVFFGLLALGVTGYFRMRSLEKTTARQSTSLPDDKIFGIHGWLRFFVISLGILGPALSLGRAAGNFRDEELAYSVLAAIPAWGTYKTAVWLTLGVFSAFSIYAALQLRFVWKPASVTLAKIAVASWPVSGLLIGVVLPLMAFRGQAVTTDLKFVGSFLALIISTVVWFVYLSRSKRVHATYMGAMTATVPINAEVPESAAPEPTLAMDAAPQQTDAGSVAVTPTAHTEEELYEIIGVELDTGNTHKATWLKAYAEADGDEKVAKSRYIKYRIDQLKQAQGR